MLVPGLIGDMVAVWPVGFGHSSAGGCVGVTARPRVGVRETMDVGVRGSGVGVGGTRVAVSCSGAEVDGVGVQPPAAKTRKVINSNSEITVLISVPSLVGSCVTASILANEDTVKPDNGPSILTRQGLFLPGRLRSN